MSMPMQTRETKPSGAKAVEQGEIPNILSQIGTVVEGLEKLAAEIQVKLMPVLSGERPEVDKKELESVSKSQLGGQLGTVRDRLMNLGVVLDRLSSRIEV